MKLTNTGKTIQQIPQAELKLDYQIKKVLSCKPILARILAEVVEECKDMSYNEIEKSIEGDVLIDRVPIEPGLFNIVGNSQEDFQVGEGCVRYDIRTYLKLDKYSEPELAKILIDVEAQKDEYTGYDLPIRGIFYCSRMISSQLGQEFSVSTNDAVKYGNIKKVYSIWICPEVAQKRANCIEKFCINKEMLCGNDNDDDRYDLMSTIIIKLSKKHDTDGANNTLINMLTDLFNETISAEKKIKILEQKYQLPITEEVEREVADMCTYTTYVENKGREREIFSSVQEGDYSIKRGAEKLGITETEFVKRMEEAGYKVSALI